eukprot:scaffold5504_cov101-Isochrysis_galbana.AAC.7
MRGDELLLHRTPLQARNLRAGVHRVQRRLGRTGIPAADELVRGAAARSELIPPPRAPRDRLDGSIVCVHLELGHPEIACVVHTKQVIVGSTG